MSVRPAESAQCAARPCPHNAISTKARDPPRREVYMSIKLITIDLDGTLLNSAKQVSERNRRALMAAEAQA